MNSLDTISESSLNTLQHSQNLATHSKNSKHPTPPKPAAPKEKGERERGGHQGPYHAHVASLMPLGMDGHLHAAPYLLLSP